MSAELKIIHPLVLICLALLMFSACGYARESNSCDQNRVCVEVQRNTDSTEVYLINKGDVPVATRTQNLKSQTPSKKFTTRNAAETQLVASHTPINKKYKTRLRYWFDWSIGDHQAQHDDSYVYRLPYARGKQYPVLQGFDSRFSHKGRERYAIDFNMPVGTPVHAARAGVVAAIEQSHNRGCWENGCGQYANYVVIVHADGTTGEYYHLQQNGVVVSEGEQVSRGQLIAYSGNTGHTTMPHLHFAVYRTVDRGLTQSLAIRFNSVEGLVKKPGRGRRYQANCFDSYTANSGS